jgi:hypothetical protein
VKGDGRVVVIRKWYLMANVTTEKFRKTRDDVRVPIVMRTKRVQIEAHVSEGHTLCLFLRLRYSKLRLACQSVQRPY